MASSIPSAAASSSLARESAFSPVPTSHKYSIDFLLNPLSGSQPSNAKKDTIVGRKRKAINPLSPSSSSSVSEDTADADYARNYLFPSSPMVPHRKATVLFNTSDSTNTNTTVTTTTTTTTTTTSIPTTPRSSKRRRTSSPSESNINDNYASKLAELAQAAAIPEQQPQHPVSTTQGNLFEKIQALPETPAPIPLEALLRSDEFVKVAAQLPDNPINATTENDTNKSSKAASIDPFRDQCSGVAAFEASFPSKKGLAPLKTRKRPNSHQRAFLEYVFRLDPWPDTASKLLIAQKIQMTAQQINTWFQNKRARSKKSDATRQSGATNNELPFQQLLSGLIKG